MLIDPIASHDSIEPLEPRVLLSGSGLPITFNLAEPGYVTLVVEDSAGQRVRNLFGEQYFEAGTHTVNWDLYDVGVPINQSTSAAPYDIERSVVTPDTYHIRGLVHDGIGLRYEFSVGSPGHTAWHTPDGSGAWLSDHHPPADVLFLPGGSHYESQSQVLLSASIAESGHSLAWVDLDGNKLFGRKNDGWNGGLALARPQGPNAHTLLDAYSINARSGQFKLYALRGDNGSISTAWSDQDTSGHSRTDGVGLATYGDKVVFSRPLDNQLVFLRKNANNNNYTNYATATLDRPRGLAADANGRLFAIVGDTLQRFDVDWFTGTLGPATTLATGLADPHGLAVDPTTSRVYVSQWGNQNRVNVYDSDGQFIQHIGDAGELQLGLYNESQMHQPLGMTIDDRGRLWVAEMDYTPKRISVWDAATGTFDQAFYGGPKYGGGGTLDPRDPTRFYYTGASVEGETGIEYQLDWQTGESKPYAIYSRDGYSVQLPNRAGETAVYRNNERYLISNHDGMHDSGAHAGVYRFDANNVAQPLGVVGFYSNNETHDWDAIDPWTEGQPFQGKKWPTVIAWSDLNLDGQVSTEELTIKTINQSNENNARVFMNDDFSWVTSRGRYFPPPTFNAEGVPVWDLDAYQEVGVGESRGEGLYADDGTFISTGGPFRGSVGGQHQWTYHSQWPNRGGGVPTPIPEPGQLIATSTLLGLSLTPTEGESGEVFFINNDDGQIYLMTTDGLFISGLGADFRVAPPWSSPDIQRGDLIGEVSFKTEHFYPSVRQLETGEVYLTAGKEHSSLLKVEGFDGIDRLDLGTVTVTAADLVGIDPTRIDLNTPPPQALDAGLRPQTPLVDGQLNDWPEDALVSIDDDRGFSGAIDISGDRLYVAYDTGIDDLLDNDLASGWEYAFASGGGLDLYLRTTTGDLNGSQLTGNDIRLFVTRDTDPINGDPLAIRFQQVGASQGNTVVYDSPVGSVTIEDVADVSADIELAQNNGVYEFSIPLSTLGMTAPLDGQATLGDFGVLLGDGAETQARFYFNGGSGLIVSDLPSEAEITPDRWATLNFVDRPYDFTPPPIQGDGLFGTYYDRIDFTGPTLTRIDATVDFNWGTGSPDPVIGPNDFSARWEGQVEAETAGNYTFSTRSDDGVRLYIDGQLVIDNWTHHAATWDESAAIYLNAGERVDLTLEYYEAGGGAVMELHWTPPGEARQLIPASQLSHGSGSTPPQADGEGLSVTYYDRIDFTGPTLTRIDPTVDFNWGTGSPDPVIGPNQFSARWQGQVEAEAAGNYTFSTRSDDGVRLYIDGQLVIDNWTNHGPTWDESTVVYLDAEERVSLTLEYYEDGGGAVMELHWTPPGEASQIIPQTQLHTGVVELPAAIAHYSFEDDLSDNTGAHHGVAHGNPTYITDSIHGTKSLELDGNDGVNLSAHDFMHNAFAQRSVAMHVKPISLSGNQLLYDEGGASNGFAIRIIDGKLQAGVTNNNQQTMVEVDLTLPPSSWFHVAAVFDSGLLSLYLNGQLVDSAMSVYASIGQHGDGGGLGLRNGGSDAFGNTLQAYFVGLIDDVRIFDSALTSLDILGLHI